MACLVVKFGGTSVASCDHIKGVARKILQLRQNGQDVVVVTSAMAGETNRLVKLTEEFQQAHPQAYDVVVSAGEQVATGLMVLALQEVGLKAEALQGWQIPIITSDHFAKARILCIFPDKVQQTLKKGAVPVIAGFQGVTEDQKVTTFGRGGSDVTAVLVAAALGAQECHLYKDVPGILSGDPKIIPEPEILDRLSIEEMFESSSQGAKIIHPRAIEAAFVHRVGLKVLPTFEEDGQGTTIVPNPLEAKRITGIVCNDHEVKVCLYDLPLSPQVSALFFDALAQANIIVDMILEGGKSADLSGHNLILTVAASDHQEVLKIATRLKPVLGFSQITVEPRISKVSIIGAGLRGHACVARDVYQTLADLGMMLYGMITTEVRMSLLVSSEYSHDFVRALHAKLGLSDNKDRKEHYDKSRPEDRSAKVS